MHTHAGSARRGASPEAEKQIERKGGGGGARGGFDCAEGEKRATKSERRKEQTFQTEDLKDTTRKLINKT